MVDSVSNNTLAINAIQPNTQYQNISFQQQYGDGSLERMPDSDIYEPEKRRSPLKTFAIGTLLILGLATGLDFLFAKGKHVKKIIGMEDKNVNKKIGNAEDDLSKKVKEDSIKNDGEVKDETPKVEEQKSTKVLFKRKSKEKKTSKNTSSENAKPKTFFGKIKEKLIQFWQWLTKPFRKNT